VGGLTQHTSTPPAGQGSRDLSRNVGRPDVCSTCGFTDALPCAIANLRIRLLENFKGVAVSRNCPLPHEFRTACLVASRVRTLGQPNGLAVQAPPFQNWHTIAPTRHPGPEAPARAEVRGRGQASEGCLRTRLAAATVPCSPSAAYGVGAAAQLGERLVGTSRISTLPRSNLKRPSLEPLDSCMAWRHLRRFSLHSRADSLWHKPVLTLGIPHVGFDP